MAISKLFSKALVSLSRVTKFTAVLLFGVALLSILVGALESVGIVRVPGSIEVQQPWIMLISVVGTIPGIVLEVGRERSEKFELLVRKIFGSWWDIITADPVEDLSIPEKEQYEWKRTAFIESAPSMYALSIPVLFLIPALLLVYGGLLTATRVAIGYIGIAVLLGVLQQGFGFQSVRITPKTEAQSEVVNTAISHLEFFLLLVGAIAQFVGTFDLPPKVIAGYLLLVFGVCVVLYLAYFLSK